ncbi:unnamed protein product [Phyllotreta striolata]|uniref:EF-hand domain-containing protein n=1 Tax=Phyllotreta striolata TaxID=444603 RepID=A0A9N9TT40_PHYSR|nr:unnamed protein product [Phyllotreta striolata]
MGCRSSKKKQIVIYLSRLKLLEYREMFDMFDEDGDGKITLEEIMKVLQSLNVHVSEAEAQMMMSDVDLDVSGTIDFGEFLLMIYTHLQQKRRKQDIIEMFNYLDVRHTGEINFEDLKIAMLSIGEDFTDEEIAEMMEEADQNGDGVIDFQEFSDLCKRLYL